MSKLVEQLRQQTQIAWETPEMMDAFSHFESLMLEAARKGHWSLQHHLPNETVARTLAARLAYLGLSVSLRHGTSRSGGVAPIFLRVSWFPGVLGGAQGSEKP